MFLEHPGIPIVETGNLPRIVPKIILLLECWNCKKERLALSSLSLISYTTFLVARNKKIGIDYSKSQWTKSKEFIDFTLEPKISQFIQTEMTFSDVYCNLFCAFDLIRSVSMERVAWNIIHWKTRSLNFKIVYNVLKIFPTSFYFHPN